MQKESIVIPGASGKPIALDVTYRPGEKRPVIVYAHGFNGFKDWGNFDLIAYRFAEAGFTFVKFNFSHNGTSPEHPQDFVDLEAFGHNNYTRQLYDLGQVLDWVCDTTNPHASAIDTERVGLIGHSMGGGIAIIKTAEDSRIRALVTWAAIAECKTPWGNWSPERVTRWEEAGVDYYINGRTKQQMPLYYQLYQDFMKNAERLDILAAASRITVPWQLCHGMEDASVSVEKAYALYGAQPNARLVTVPGDHVFDRRHPWKEDALPGAMQGVLDRNTTFFSESLSVR